MSNSKIELHKAKLISDYYGNVYSNDVLDELDEGDIVRISFVVHEHYYEDAWTHDTPYVCIIKKEDIQNEDQDEESIESIDFVGEIYDYNRQETDKYPFPIGERILFSKNNIIEIIDDDLQTKSPQTKSKYYKYLTEEKILVTGPLYTIEFNNDSDSDSDSEFQDLDNTEDLGENVINEDDGNESDDEYVSDSD